MAILKSQAIAGLMRDAWGPKPPALAEPDRLTLRFEIFSQGAEDLVGHGQPLFVSLSFAVDHFGQRISTNPSFSHYGQAHHTMHKSQKGSEPGFHNIEAASLTQHTLHFAHDLLQIRG